MMRSTLIAALVSAALPMMALAQTEDELKNDEKTPGDVLTYGMGYSQNRFSPLTQINRDNVKRLVPAWSYSMADNRGQDAQAIALDLKTGKEVWRTKSADPKDGYSMTVAPLVANGVVIAGVAGAEFGHRGYLEGFDPQTGKSLWRTYTIPAKGEPGSETWPGDAAAHGGGSTWITGSYDPELDLVFWGTGNPAPWNPLNRLGDNLYTNSVLAIQPKTGKVVWHYQMTPSDPFDYDGVSEWVQAELTIDGTPRKVVMQANRNGFLYVLERATGKLLAANKFVKVTWAERVDMATGRPVWSAETKAALDGKTVQV